MRTICLNGIWDFRLDRKRIGEEKGWFRRPRLSEKINLPGLVTDQGFGEKSRKALSLQMPAIPSVTQKWAYKGDCWFHKRFALDGIVPGRKYWLVIGGAIPRIKIWVNGEAAGEGDGCFIETRHNITAFVRKGENHVVILNADYPRSWARVYDGGILDPNGQGLNGVYRDIRVVEKNATEISYARVATSLDPRSMTIDTEIDNPENRALSLSFRLTMPSGKTLALRGEGLRQNVFPVKDAPLWSDANPALCDLEIALLEKGRKIDRRRERFGFRSFAVSERDILLNGAPIYLRGFGYDQEAVGPKPLVDKKQLRHRLALAKRYGFNFANFLCSFPTPEFLDVADEVGLLIQAYPGDLRNKTHLEQVLRQHINHPSLMVYALRAEDMTNNAETTREYDATYDFIKSIDPERLVLARGGSLIKNIGHGKSDFYELGLNADIHEAKDTPAAPATLHEYAWWSSWPDPKSRPQYARFNQTPFFIDIMRDACARKGTSKYVRRFVDNTQRLQAIERKTGLEKARKIQELAGYNLWLLTDFGPSCEGVLNDFWEPKNVSAEAFRRYNDATVLLMENRVRGNNEFPYRTCEVDREFQRRDLWEGSDLDVDILISHYAEATLENATLETRLIRDGAVTMTKTETIARIAPYRVQKIAECHWPVPLVGTPAKITLSVRLSAGERRFENAWDFWSFPRVERLAETAFAYGDVPYPQLFGKVGKGTLSELPPDTPIVAGVLDDRVLAALRKGARVFLLAGTTFPLLHGSYMSIIWNGFSIGNSGSLIYRHPALGDFPHEGWGDLQCYDLFNNDKEYGHGPINMDRWPLRIDPIIRSIGSYYFARNRGFLFEVGAGAGKLMVSKLNFVDSPAATYLFRQIVDYCASSRFSPREKVSLAFLERYADSEKGKRRRRFLATPNALPCHPPDNAFDNDPDTFWAAEVSPESPASCCCRLAGKTPLTGLEIVFFECLKASYLRKDLYLEKLSPEGFSLETLSSGGVWENAPIREIKETSPRRRLYCWRVTLRSPARAKAVRIVIAKTTPPANRKAHENDGVIPGGTSVSGETRRGAYIGVSSLKFLWKKRERSGE